MKVQGIGAFGFSIFENMSYIKTCNPVALKDAYEISKTWLKERLHYFEKKLLTLTWKNSKYRDIDVSVINYRKFPYS